MRCHIFARRKKCYIRFINDIVSLRKSVVKLKNKNKQKHSRGSRRKKCYIRFINDIVSLRKSVVKLIFLIHFIVYTLSQTHLNQNFTGLQVFLVFSVSKLSATCQIVKSISVELHPLFIAVLFQTFSFAK